jgi:hypothetical protein
MLAELGNAGSPGSRAERGDPLKCGVRVALGVAGGYLLGRTKKMKLAMMLGGMAAGRQAGGPGQLFAQGVKLLGQSPELSRLTDELRGRLLDAGKGAAVAVATRQVENLTERVVSRVGPLTDAGGKAVRDVGGTVGETVSGVGKTVGGLGRRRSREDVEDVEDEEGPGEEEPGEEGGGEPAGLNEVREDAEGGPARTGAGGNGAGNAAPKRAGGRARLAGKAAAATRRSARPRTAGEALEKEQRAQEEESATDETAPDETAEEELPEDEAAEDGLPEDGLPEDGLPEGEGELNDEEPETEADDAEEGEDAELPPERGFHFRTENRHTGSVATNLRQFVAELERCDAAVLHYHTAAGDFSRWAQDVLRDAALAKRLRHIEGHTWDRVDDEPLRRELLEATA